MRGHSRGHYHNLWCTGKCGDNRPPPREMNHTEGIPTLLKREEFHPWALRQQCWGCSDMEKASPGARKCTAICIDFLPAHELMWWIYVQPRKPKPKLLKSGKSGELHSEGREIWGCKIREHILLHTPLTNTSQPSMFSLSCSLKSNIIY